MVRIVWPNGSPQTEFRKDVDTTVVAEQRTKGSCPFLFTWNGERFVFVTDFMWSTPLGMYINAQDQGGFLQTAEWVKVRGDQLVPREGHYEVRINANLWETHYFDHLSLRVIDHPADTELFADERFMLVPSKPVYHLMEQTRPVARAWDHHGEDVTDLVRAIDGKYLDRAGRGRYQGITNDHWVEVDLGDDAPREGPVWLVAHGWIHPTDSSVNFALEQGQHERAASARAGSARRQGRMEGGPRQDRLPGREEQDRPVASRWPGRTGCRPSVPPPHEHGDLLGRVALRARARRRYPDRKGPASRCRGPAPPWYPGYVPGRPEFTRAARLRSHRLDAAGVGAT